MNGIDDNCNGIVDDIDQDGDGYYGCGSDCNDTNPAINPGAVEICNGVDDDCDGLIDNRDFDGDGYAVCADCNDANPAIHPGATETCNGVDDDCNGVVDDRDLDGDGFSACSTDCYDADPTVWHVPVEVTHLSVSGASSSQISWDSQAALAGPGTHYDLASGVLGSNAGLNVGSAECLQSDDPATQITDTRPQPAVGFGAWYLARARNLCDAAGTYGADSHGMERSIPACP